MLRVVRSVKAAGGGGIFVPQVQPAIEAYSEGAVVAIDWAERKAELFRAGGDERVFQGRAGRIDLARPGVLRRGQDDGTRRFAEETPSPGPTPKLTERGRTRRAVFRGDNRPCSIRGSGYGDDTIVRKPV